MSDSLERLLRQSRPTLFGAPRWKPKGEFDVVVVGIPSDIGNLGSPRSTSTGVTVLRGASRLFPFRIDEHDCPLGWYDYEQGRAILRGIRIADAGDLVIDRYHPTASLDRVPDMLRALKRTSRLVLILGGDHAITHWTSGALPDGGRIVIFDAHEDSTSITGTLPHAGNVVRFLEQRSNIGSILQFGLRGLVPADRCPPARLRTVCSDMAAFVSALGKTATEATMLSVDVDVISPEILRSVAAPSPGGLHPRDLVLGAAAIQSAGGSIQYLEIAEFAPMPGEDPLTGMMLMQLIVRLLDVCLAGRS